MKFAFELLIREDLLWRVLLRTETDELEDPEVCVGVFGGEEWFYYTENQSPESPKIVFLDVLVTEMHIMEVDMHEVYEFRLKFSNRIF